MQVNMKEKKLWILILVGILVPVLLSGCVAPTSREETQDLKTEDEGLKVEIAELKEQIARLQAQIANLQGENQALKNKLATVGVPLEIGEVVIGKVFKIPGCKVTLSSYEILNGGTIRFDLVIENLFEQPAKFRFIKAIGVFGPYILDNQGNKYYTSEVSPVSVLVPPGMPIEGHMTFTHGGLKEARAITFYFKFRIRNPVSSKLSQTDVLHFGPIELR